MEYSRKVRDVAFILTIGIFGVLVSAFAWYLLFIAENRAFVQEFDSRAHNQAIILQGGIHDYWDQLYALQALFEFLKSRHRARSIFAVFKVIANRSFGRPEFCLGSTR